MQWLQSVKHGVRVAAFVALSGWSGQLCAAETAPAPASPPAATAQPAAPPPAPADPGTAAPSAPADPGTPAPPADKAPEAAPEPPADGDASNALPIDVTPRPVALLRGNSTWEDGYKNINAAFVKINGEITKSGLKAAGRPITAFVETDDTGFHYEAMVPIEKAPEGKESLTPEVRLGQSPGGKAMKFQHRGAYDDIDSTYEAVTAYLDEKGIEARNLFVEEYLNEMKSQEDAGTQIDIYVFIK